MVEIVFAVRFPFGVDPNSAQKKAVAGCDPAEPSSLITIHLAFSIEISCFSDSKQSSKEKFMVFTFLNIILTY